MAEECVLVTGASSGIGLELAKLFAADGAHLVLVARRKELLERLAAELGEVSGGGVRVLPKDLRDPAAPRQIFDALSEAGVAVDVLVNDAGFGGIGRVFEQDEQRQADMIQVNVTALTRLTRLFLPAMLARRRGGVLNVASTAAFQPGPMMAVYYATKAYDLFFTEALAEELRGTGVTATALCPGPTRTGFQAVAGMERVLLMKYATGTAEGVARTGHRAFRKGKALAVPGLGNWLGAQTVRFTPRFAMRRLVKALQS